MGELVKYEAMCQAIAEAHAVDEAKEIRDKAIGIEAYAKQAKNMEAERLAVEIRVRAERRLGELIRAQREAGLMSKGGGTGANQHRATPTRKEAAADGPPTLADAGIDHKLSSRAQKLAAIPTDEFEKSLADKSQKPSPAAMISKANGETTPMDPSALWIAGRVRDWARDHKQKAPNELVSEMTVSQIEDLTVLLPDLISWLKELHEGSVTVKRYPKDGGRAVSNEAMARRS